ncbi:MAG: hypothetical protein IPK80_27240 [Nannocystis sp.]|nr:hypothetical protein [Nannocystis sp.]
MASLTPQRRVIALVGGIAEAKESDRQITDDSELRLFGSVREAGVGELRRLLLSLKRGSIDEERIITCWIGHSQSRAITKACKKLGIPVRRFDSRGRAHRAK